MAYIQPDGLVQFFGDIGLSPNYDNTLYFATTASKDSYFDSLLKIATATAITYSRENRGFIRVEKPMSIMYNVGYMRFKNTGFENKWFYAFVKSVNYINNVTTEVEFDLDVMMTWMGSFLLKKCFIERQHTASDTIGEHIVDEGIPCGDLKNDFVTSSGYIGSNGFWYCFASTFDPNDNFSDVQGALYGGVYSGVTYSYTNDPDVLNNWISGAIQAGKSDGIVGIAIVPYSFITEADDPPVERTQTFAKPYSNVNGYTPKNNKLFIYPYKSIEVTNLEGNFAEFRYEFFTGNNAQFRFIGSTGLNTEIVCCPENYKGSTDNITEKISMSDFPMCTYVVDAFQAYWAQNKSSISASVVSSMGSVVASLISGAGGISVEAGTSPIANTASAVGGAFGNAGSQAVSAGSGILQTLAGLKDYMRKPPHAGGSQGTSALFGRTTGRQKKDFWFVGKTITAEYARIIDDYFSMFGYKLNIVDTPNMNVRPHWTYVKTMGCIVEGSLPADDAAKIENIFDNGIRFWKNYAEIGNYSLNNAPT